MPDLKLDILHEEIEYASANGDWQGAFEAYEIARDWLDESGLAKNDPSAYADYRDSVMKLKFLSLNFFDDDQDYYDLLKNHYSLSQEIPNFDLWQKLELQLISMKDVRVRDAFKAKLREALEKSESPLISRQQYDDPEMPYKVGDWIKDIVSNLGLDSFDKLKKMEYLGTGKFVKVLKESDKEKVKTLLDIYEKLKLSSLTPAGYENPVLMNIDGKVVVFNHGEVEDVSPSALKGLKPVQDESLSVPIEKVEGVAPASPPIASPAVSVEKTVRTGNPLYELESALSEYPESSLEHKAIKQEISRVKAAKLRAAQKSDVSQSR